MEHEQIQKQTEAWLKGVVIGLNLCPFAAAVHRNNQIRIHVSSAHDPNTAIRDALAEISTLLDASEEKIATTLIVYPKTLDAFEDYLDAVADLEQMLSDAGADGLLQIATFHPEYQFEGVAFDDLANWTNRSPYPIVHLLREEQVSDAVDTHHDPESIPEQNIARLRELGVLALKELWEGWAD